MTFTRLRELIKSGSVETFQTIFEGANIPAICVRDIDDIGVGILEYKGVHPGEVGWDKVEPQK